MSMPSLFGMFILFSIVMPFTLTSEELKNAIVQFGERWIFILLSRTFLQPEKMIITPGRKA
jgi:hypothetical protein